MITKYNLMTVGLVLLAGCSTPQVVLDQANQGVALVSQMELELKEFRRIEMVSEQAHKDILAQQKAAVVRNAQVLSVDNRARQAAGATQVNRVIDSMTVMIQGLANDEVQATAVLSASDKTLANLLAPLPSTTATSTSTQSALATMGKELPLKTRATELKGLVAKVKESVEANKKKIKDAEAVAANP